MEKRVSGRANTTRYGKSTWVFDAETRARTNGGEGEEVVRDSERPEDNNDEGPKNE